MEFKKIYIAVDPATSEDQHNDCTAIVAGMKFYEKTTGERRPLTIKKIFVLPEFVNARLGFGSAIEAILKIHERMKNTYGVSNHQIKILIENAGQQKTFYDRLKDVCQFPPNQIEFISTKGMDKRSRVAGACSYIQSKRIFFPEKGLEDLITQLLYFGAEKFDDLADAFSLMVNTAMLDKSNSLNMAVEKPLWPLGVAGISRLPKDQQIAYYDEVQRKQEIVDEWRWRK